jgi:hypothetical protein
MSKPMLYAIFIVKFLFGLGLIIWTVMMTLSSDVGLDDDNAFLSSYHKIDDDFNNMVKSNIDFEKKYNFTIELNGKSIDGLTIKDVFLSQRVIKDRKDKKNLLKVGINSFRYKISAKNNQIPKDIKVNMLVTMTTNHTFDQKLNFENKTQQTFKIEKKGYWNITGTIEVDGDKGYYFIKTDAN